MDADQFRAALDRLDLKQTGERGAETFLGVNGTTVRRWARGTIPVPDTVAMLLRLMIARRMKPETVRARYGG